MNTRSQHASALDVAIARRQGQTPGIPAGAMLPLYARVALERLSCESFLRTAEKLDELLQAYAATYGEAVDLNTCAAVHDKARQRWAEFSGADLPRELTSEERGAAAQALEEAIELWSCETSAEQACDPVAADAKVRAARSALLVIERGGLVV